MPLQAKKGVGGVDEETGDGDGDALELEENDSGSLMLEENA